MGKKDVKNGKNNRRENNEDISKLISSIYEGMPEEEIREIIRKVQEQLSKGNTYLFALKKCIRRMLRLEQMEQPEFQSLKEELNDILNNLEKEIRGREPFDKLILAGVTKEDFKKIKDEMERNFKAQKTTKSSKQISKNEIKDCIRALLTKLEENNGSETEETKLELLSVLSDRLIEICHFDELEDLDDMLADTKNRDEALLILKAHSKTLFDGKANIPKNFSKKYFGRLLSERYKDVGDDEILIAKPEIADFLYRLGESEFAANNVEEYKSLINEFVMGVLDNSEQSNIPGIANNRKLLYVVIQYIRALQKDKELPDIDKFVLKPGYKSKTKIQHLI